MHLVNIFKTLGIFYFHWVLYFLELVRHYLAEVKAGSRRVQRVLALCYFWDLEKIRISQKSH